MITDCTIGVLNMHFQILTLLPAGYFLLQYFAYIQVHVHCTNNDQHVQSQIY